MQERKHKLDEADMPPMSPKRARDETSEPANTLDEATMSPISPKRNHDGVLKLANQFSQTEDEACMGPPVLEIVDVGEDFVFSRPDEAFQPPRSKCVGITVRMDTGDHFLVEVYEWINVDDVRNLNLDLLDLTSVPIKDIPNAFASWLASDFGIGVESTHASSKIV